MKRVALIDYGAGNLGSMRRALEECGAHAVPTADPAVVLSADAVVLPGVGAFQNAMRRLGALGLIEAVTRKVVERQAPFLGVCLGMQLLAGYGFEPEKTPGLGWIEGIVDRLSPCAADERIPHVGWNEVHFRPDAPLFRGLEPGVDFYFVHSYSLRPRHARVVTATTPFCGGFVSAIGMENVHGVQFHPEKSQKPGFTVLKNFLSL